MLFRSDQKKLSSAGRVMMRIAAAQARRALGEFGAAVLTLQCSELNTRDAAWSRTLQREYRDSLIAAGRDKEAEFFAAKFPETFLN